MGISQEELDQYVARMRSKFQALVEEAAALRGWNIVLCHGTGGELQMINSLGITRSCALVHDAISVTFFVPSRLTFDSVDELPHHLATNMLVRNDTSYFGHWCLEELDDKFTCTCMKREKISDMDVETFWKSINGLFAECDNLEESIYRNLPG